MNAVFADTFYRVALTLPRDADHRRASRFQAAIVTIQEVWIEYLNFFAAGWQRLRRKAAMTVEDILDDPALRVIPQSREWFRAGLDLYRERPDKGYRLTDCISVATMRKAGLTEALTNDGHFEQEGFRALFR